MLQRAKSSFQLFVSFFQQLGEVGQLSFKTFQNIFKKPWEKKNIIQQLEEIGVKSLPVDELERVMRPVSSLKVAAGIRADYYGKSEFVKSSISLSFWPTTKKYLLTQITHDPWLDKFRYSAQGGIQWGAFSSRVGIIESEIGAGIDYFGFGNKLRLSLESFDFNRHPRPHFRIWTRIAAFKHVFFIFGIDDFTLAPEREIFFGLELGIQ